MQIIIYNDENGAMHRIRPTGEFLSKYTIDQCAQKDVPAGLPYKIIDDSELPTNWKDRDVWEIDDSELTDGVGAEWSTMENAP